MEKKENERERVREATVDPYRSNSRQKLRVMLNREIKREKKKLQRKRTVVGIKIREAEIVGTNGKEIHI